MDADLVDGLNSSAFVRADANDTKTGSLVMLDSFLRMDDNLELRFGSSNDIRMDFDGSDFSSRSFANGAAFNFEGNDSGGTLRPLLTLNPDGPIHLYHNGSVRLSTTASGVNVSGTLTVNGGDVWSASNDGAGSGLDADLLDGQSSAFYRNASNINAGTLAESRLPYRMNQNMRSTDNVSFARVTVNGRYLDYPTGQYGSIQINGGGAGNWEGFSIDGRAVFMHNGTDQTGIYDDVNNKWHLRALAGAQTQLYYDGQVKAETRADGFYIGGLLRADRLVDSQNSGYDVDPSGTSDLATVNVENINVSGIATFSGATPWLRKDVDETHAAALSVQTLSSGSISTSGFNGSGTFFASVGGNSMRLVSGSGLLVNGNIEASGTIYSNSDARMKEAVRRIGKFEALELVARLQPVRYQWREEYQATAQMMGDKVGFIAQEVETVVPEVVNFDSRGMRTLDYAALSSIFVGAINAQQQQIVGIQTDVTALQADIAGIQQWGIGVDTALSDQKMRLDQAESDIRAIAGRTSDVENGFSTIGPAINLAIPTLPSDSLQKVLALKGVTINPATTLNEYIGGGYAIDPGSVSAVMPSAIVNHASGNIQVNYDSILAITVDAVKAQQQLITENARRIDEHEQRLDEKDDQVVDLQDTDEQLEERLDQASRIITSSGSGVTEADGCNTVRIDPEWMSAVHHSSISIHVTPRLSEVSFALGAGDIASDGSVRVCTIGGVQPMQGFWWSVRGQRMSEEDLASKAANEPTGTKAVRRSLYANG